MKVNGDGFTIIELMIATAVFTVILLITTAALIGISQTYIKGSVQDNTQQSARSIVEDISQGIQFNDPSTITLPTQVGTSDIYYFCIGNDEYVYNLDLKLASYNASFPNENSTWALVRYQTASSGCTTPGPTFNNQASYNSEELLSKNERLGQLSITQLSGQNVYTVALVIGYGDNDLLQDYKNYSGATKTTQLSNGTNNSTSYNYSCVSGSDNSYCSVSALTTTIATRITIQ